MFKSFLLNRRQFLKVAGITTGAVVAGSGASFARTLPGRRTTLARSEDRTVLISAPANTIHTACNMCSNFCAASAIRETVAGRTIVRRVEGRTGHPNTRGGLCAKGQAAVQLLYDPDRLKTPLRKRADGSWEVRSWTDALNDVADGLQAIRGTTAPSTDAAARRAASRVYFLNRRGSYGGMWGAFRAEFGSKNVAASAPICDAAKRLGTWLAVSANRRVRDQRFTNYTLLFGRNELEATRYRLGFSHELLQNIKDGGRLVVVDPRRTYTASKAHQYVQITPGTDLMMILSMCRVILDNSLTAAAQVPGAAIAWEANPWANVARLNAGSVTRLAAFRDELYKVTDNQYAPAAASLVCGVPAAVITRLAGEFCGVIDPATGNARPRPVNWAAVADTTSGIAKYSNGTMTAWAMLCLTGLTGSMNISGGYVAVAGSPASTAWSFGSPSIGAQADESLTRAAGYPFSGNVSTANTEGYRTLIPYAILNGLPRTHPDFRRVPAGPLAAPPDGTGVITTDANGDRWADVYGGGSAIGGGGIRGLFINHTDPAVVDAESDLWARALPRLQFAVAIDVYLNTTHELFPPGSYVLPECTALERTDATTPTTVSGETVMNLWQQAVAPLHDSRSGYSIFASLGAAMSTRHGIAGGYFAPDAAAAAYNTAAAGTGRVHRHTPANEVQFTQSIWGNTANAGRVWSTVTANGGIWTTGTHTDAAEPEVRFSFTATETNTITLPLLNVHEFRQVWENTSATTFATPLAPQWRAPQNTPTSTFPLRFMAGGKVMWHTMAATANLPYLVQDFDQSAEVRHTNYLLISPTDAAARGIASGSWVFVASANGSRLRVQALVTERIMPGYVSLFHGYGEQAPTKRTAHNRGVNPNRLTSSRRIDAGTGQFTPNEEVVQVIRA